MKSFTATLCLLASASSVLGHATFQQLWVDGVDQAKTCVREPSSNSPVADVTSAAMACNTNGAAGVPGICPVDAGSKVIVEMHQHNTRSCTEEAIGGAHHGPVIVYMSKVTDATTADGSGKWFKVAEDGYDPVTKAWGETHLNANCGKFEFTVPSDIATGDYLIRAEEIALHAAGSSGGAQFYMSCYQVHVAGTGTATPAGVSFPGAYAATDAGILINIYQTIDDYIIPGPEVYVSGGASAPAPAEPAAPAPSSTVVAAPASTSAAPVSTSAAAVPTPTSVASAPSATSPAEEYPEYPEETATPTVAVPSTPTATSAPVTTPVDDEYEDCEEL